MHQSSSVFKAYIEEFNNHKRKQTDNLARVDTCNYIYQQRLTKSLYDAFQVFFIPEAMQLYHGLEFINEKRPFKDNYLDKNDPEKMNMLSVSLGQVVMVTLKISQVLGIPLKHPMIYNSFRSCIVKQERSETRILPLYVAYKTDYKTLDLAIKLLGRNLKNIVSTLTRIEERQGFGKAVALNGQEQARVEPRFQNVLLFYLFRIADFQVY